jgi:hypothetical protein
MGFDRGEHPSQATKHFLSTWQFAGLFGHLLDMITAKAG